jgi:Transport and Golgi organisation 2
MCLLALFFRVVEDAPVVAGANREEFYNRGGEPPQILKGPYPAVAGVDPLAGGTWFGVNERGVFIAITNRPKSALPAKPRSRGLLARELLGCATAAAAVDNAAQDLDRGRYAGCNLVCADQESAAVIHAGDWLRIRPVPPGLHVLTSHDVNDASDRRLGHALWWLSQRNYACAEDCLFALKELCAQSGNGDPPICVRGERSGTVSSSIVALRSPLACSSYLHAQGPPDRTPYTDYSHLLQQLSSIPAEKRGPSL